MNYRACQIYVRLWVRVVELVRTLDVFCEIIPFLFPRTAIEPAIIVQ